MHGVIRDPVLDQCHDPSPDKILPDDLSDRLKEHRVVRHNEIGARLQRFFQRIIRQIQGAENSTDLFLLISDKQADVVPVHRIFLRISLFQFINNISALHNSNRLPQLL